ncbi:hypothetical protein D3C76_130660 [compost metagenome]
MRNLNNRSKVQNPLTIIAIFAGLAELAGTGVLLGLPNDVQNIFVWFVMGFPVGLVLAFFLVLVLKHEVLYAPSDFVDENNFIELLKQKKVQQDLVEASGILQEAKQLATEHTINNEPETYKELLERFDIVLEKLDSAKQTNNSDDVDNYLTNQRKRHERAKSVLLKALYDAGDEGLARTELAKKLNINLMFLQMYADPLIDQGLIIFENGRYKVKHV